MEQIAFIVSHVNDKGIAARCKSLLDRLRENSTVSDAHEVWFRLTRGGVLTPDVPFEAHRLAYEYVYNRPYATRGKVALHPAWLPDSRCVASSNITRALDILRMRNYDDLYHFSHTKREEFWKFVVDKVLHIEFRTRPTKMLHIDPPTKHSYLVGAEMNIVETCFHSASEIDFTRPAVIFQRTVESEIETWSMADLLAQTHQIANGFQRLGIGAGDRVALCMTMTAESVALYFAIVKIGAVVVSIPDSFSAEEIGTRLRVANCDLIVCHDVITRNGKDLPMHPRVSHSGVSRCIVIPFQIDCGSMKCELRSSDLSWSDFILGCDNTDSPTVISPAQSVTNILFSSGTTGEPKAIPWSHSTPIKAAMDGFFHHDIREGDVVCWPTNMGWMMGPWLIYASILNRASIALFGDVPMTTAFPDFVNNAGVTMLGLVPSIVKAARKVVAPNFAFHRGLRCFSSTGEASNPDDMLWLMSRVPGYAPVIEYCGGTEIGGGYVSSTVVQPNIPSFFSTACLGLELVLLSGEADAKKLCDENKLCATNIGDRCTGQIAIVPPSIGLSTTLLNKNRNHHKVYFQDMPSRDSQILRRHGDEMEFVGTYYRALGRCDDTMNLGGIKVSSVEIERTLMGADEKFGVQETAAVAVPPVGGGPAQLIVFAVLHSQPGAGIGCSKTSANLKKEFQRVIRADLNPLFRVHQVKIVAVLPRTASNKVMRRILRDKYQKSQQIQSNL